MKKDIKQNKAYIKYAEFIGETRNYLTALELKPSGRTYKYICKCKCGNITETNTWAFLNNTAKSCGCRRGDANRKKMQSWKAGNKKHSTEKHGHKCRDKNNITYTSFSGLKYRCLNPNSSSYKNYGGRGIKVCDRWLDKELGFANFLSDMGERPSKAHSIERKDVNGNYCPENCIWIVSTKQPKNRTTSKLITIDGDAKILEDWCRQFKIDSKIVNARLKIGWDAEKALKTPRIEKDRSNNIAEAYKLLGHENLIVYGFRGSRIRNLQIEDSDFDYTGCYIAGLDFYFGFDKTDNIHYIRDNVDITLFELQNLIRLLQKSNPNVLELLWTDRKHLFYVSDIFEELQANRSIFVSKKVFDTYTGYAKDQIKKMREISNDVLVRHSDLEILLQENGVDVKTLKAKQVELDSYIGTNTLGYYIDEYKALNNTYFSGGKLGEKRKNLIKRIGYNSKNAAVAILLLKQSIEMLETSNLRVDRSHDRDELLAIKRGEWSLNEVKDYAEKLFDLAAKAVVESNLPDDVDRVAIENLTVKVLSKHFGIKG